MRRFLSRLHANSQQRTRRASFKPALEQLEKLVLPTVTLSGFDATLGTITFTGDGSDDSLILAEVPQGGGVSWLGYKQGSDPSFITDLGSGNHLVIGSGSAPSITVNLAGGNDTLTIDNSWTFQHAATVDAGAGTNTFNGPGLNVDWNLSGTTGDLTSGDAPTLDPTSAISFSGFQTLQGGASTDTFLINAAATASLKGGAAADTFVFAEDATLTGTIAGEGGNDTLDFGSYTTQVSVTLTSSVAAGYTGTDGLSSGFSGIDVAVAGTSGSDVLIGQNITSTWNLNDDLTYSNGSQTFTLEGFQTLQGGTGTDTFNIVVINTADLKGGSGADSFVFSDTATLEGTIDGEAGSDTLTLAAYTAPVSIALTGSGSNGFSGSDGVSFGFSNVDVLVGSSASDILSGYDAASTWSLAGTRTYTADSNTLTFSAFEDLQGGSAADSFVFGNGATWSGTLDGGTGSDQLDLSAYTTAVNVALASSDSTGYSGAIAGILGNFSGINSVTGGTSSTLTGESVDATWTLDSSLAYSDGVGSLSFAGFSILQGGVGVDTFNIVASTTANLKGGDGDDAFQFQTDNVALTGSITGEEGANTLSYAGYTSTAVTITITSSSSISGFGGTATNLSGGFTGIASVVGGAGADTMTGRNVAGTWSVAASQSYSVGAAALALSGFETYQGGSAVDTFDISVSTAINLKGGGANDAFIFTVDGVSAGNIDGEAGTDILSYAGFTSNVAVTIGVGMTGIETLVGGSGSDTLVGANVANTWAITGNNAGTVGSTSFSSFENLTGGSDVDTFVLSNGKVVTGAINGGGGTDTLNFANYSSAITMTTTGSNAGSISGSFTFSAVENWTGGKGNDAVVFTAGNTLTGTVSGGLGSDTLNFAAYSANLAVSVTAGNGGTIGSMTFAAMENWTGGSGDDTLTFSAGKGFTGTVNGGSGTDVLNLAAFSTAITVAVSGNDTGRIAAPGVGYAFASMESWTGGSGNDAVIFANGKGLTGTLNGGTGTDRLDYAAYLTGVLVDLSVPEATSTGSVAAFENVTGGRGSDILIGNASANVLIGNAGRNILVGNAGNDRLVGGISRDILIGGAGDDVLSGGGDSDLLIAGTTDHDATTAALAALMSEWARTDIGYAARISHLNGSVGGGNNGATVLDATTVASDAGADTLAGAAGLDWFLISSGDSITDKKRKETKTTI